jgi:hypothetical protein
VKIALLFIKLFSPPHRASLFAVVDWVSFSSSLDPRLSLTITKDLARDERRGSRDVEVEHVLSREEVIQPAFLEFGAVLRQSRIEI